MRHSQIETFILPDLKLSEPDTEQLAKGLVETYGANVQRIAYSYVKDREIAKDISQEVFMSCLCHLHTLRGKSEKAWIYRITVNKCLDLLRKKAYKYRLHGAELHENIPSRETPTESAIVHKTEAMQVRQAIQQLPGKYKEAISLYYLADLEIDEISSRLGINPRTISSRLHRGRNLLRTKLRHCL